MAGFDHVLLDVGAEPVLGTEERRQLKSGVGREAISGVPELAVDGGWVRDETRPHTREVVSVEEPLEPEADAHREIIEVR
jgi:hypothetical protein